MGQTPVLVDTDMSMDAVMAILYILQQPQLSVRAITVVGTGETHCEPGTAHALGLVAIAGARDIPVACGRTTPLRGLHQFPAGARERADKGPGITWPEVGKPSSLSAPELLRKALRDASEPVVVVTDGPLTNLADLFQLDPQVPGKIKMIYVMGGAFDVPGNLSAALPSARNKTAEFNMYVDPRAANLVLASGAPLTLVPLDAADQVPLDTSFYKQLSQYQDTAAAKAVYGMLTETRAYQDKGKLFDPLVHAIATDPTLAGYATKRVAVVEEEGADAGRTVVTAQGKEVRIATSVNVDRFMQTFLKGLNGGR